MSALPLRAFRPPPAALAAAPPAPHILRPIHGARHIHPLGRRGSSSALLKMQARTRDPFRSNSTERPDNLCEPEPEPENHDSSDKGAASGNHPLVDKLLKYVQAARAEMGIRETPDMFIMEKEQISSYEDKLFSSRGPMDVEEKVVPSRVCERAKEALDLASDVMDIAGLRRGTIQFSQHTVDQMVRTYAAIFCNAAEDAYYNKFKMETALSFLGALRGLGAIYHILAQDTVAKLKDGRFKNSISCHMGKHSQDFDKVMKYWEDLIVKIKPLQMADVLFHCILYAHGYIGSLAHYREAALSYLKD